MIVDRLPADRSPRAPPPPAEGRAQFPSTTNRPAAAASVWREPCSAAPVGQRQPAHVKYWLPSWLGRANITNLRQLARGAARVLPPAAAAVVGRRAARRLRRRLFIIKHKMNTEWHLARSRERSLRARVSISCEANSNSPEHPRRAEPDSDGAADRAKKQTASLDRSISLLCLVVGVVSRRRAECRARLLAPCPRRLSAGLVARFRRANFH